MDLFTRSLAAWYLGRAANRWVQPQKIAKAIARARRGFVELGDTGWVAACDWMSNDLPWICTDFITSETQLKNAAVILKKKGFFEFSYHCRLALSQNQILLDEFADATTNIAICEEVYKQSKDSLNLARCWKNRSILFRRIFKYEEARYWALQAEEIFTQFQSKSDIGIIWNLLGLIKLFTSTDVEGTLYWFTKAKVMFENLDLPVWVATEHLNCGLVYNQDTQLKNSFIAFSQAEKILRKYKSLGLYADLQMSFGKLFLLRGHPEQATKYLQQARQLHLSLGMRTMAVVDKLGIAEAYWMNSRYQEAIKIYEELLPIFHDLNNSVQIGLCEMRLSQIWLSIGDYKLALDHILQAEEYLHVTNQLDSTISILLLKARIATQTEKIQFAKELYEEALHLSNTNNLLPQLAITRQALGRFLTLSKNYIEAEKVLSQSIEYFILMGQEAEQCNCLIAIGKLYYLMNNKEKAIEAYKNALVICNGKYSEYEWRIYAGFAEMEIGEEALGYYRKSIKLLKFIRDKFWQPDLSGLYSQNPKMMISKAIELASRQTNIEDLFSFIESDKANSLNQQFTLIKKNPNNLIFEELSDDKAEINLIKQMLQTLSKPNSTMLGDLKIQELQTRLKAKKVRFDVLKAQIDRKHETGNTSFQRRDLSLEECRQMLNTQYGLNWVSLNFYQLEDQIVSVLLTPDISQTLTTSLTPRLKKALHLCQQSHQNSLMPSISDLGILGECLIPAAVQACLTPETSFLIIPHQTLHGIPWAAIGEVPLITKCLPVIAPSHKSLALIWEHNERNDSAHARIGLLAGASRFEGRYPDLPAVKDELEALQIIGNGQMIRAVENTAAFEELKQSLGDREQPSFDCLHLSTHFFSEPESGRLSGIALQNEDIFVDQLRDLSPLPSLVTFSGCNSLFGQIYAGDEQISLPNTCFLAGATNVIGSVWPVLDRSTISIMTRFYTHYLTGVSPAKALASAQRESFQEGDELRSWAGYCCLGIP